MVGEKFNGGFRERTSGELAWDRLSEETLARGGKAKVEKAKEKLSLGQKFKNWIGRHEVGAAVALLAVGFFAGWSGYDVAYGGNVERQPVEIEQEYGGAEAEALWDNDLRNVTPEKMKTLELETVVSNERYNEEVGSVQGFAVTDKYLVTVNVIQGASGKGWATALDKDNPGGGYVWVTELDDVFHGNGATWNSETNEVVIIVGKNRIYLDAESGEVTRRMTEEDAMGIAYNGEGYVRTIFERDENDRSGRVRAIVDKGDGSSREFEFKSPLNYQDIAYRDGDIYQAAWGGAEYLDWDGRTEDAEICREKFGEGSNAIYRFSEEGDYKDAFYIPAGAGELESLAFAPDGAPYLLFNEAGNFSICRAGNMV